MGNTLCKEPNSSLRPGRVLDNFGSLMCPNGIGKSKPGISKTYLSRHVLETGAKSNTLTSWNSATLTVPDGNVIDRPPLAPPRKKRGNTLERGTTSLETLKVKNGFKDCFGPDSRRPSRETTAAAAAKSQDTVDHAAIQGKSSFEIDAKNDAFSDFSKVPTKTELEKPSSEDKSEKGAKKACSSVGNRKSDKFFGESLSDSLSNEPMVKERRRSSKKGMEDLDKIDMFIEKNVLNNQAKDTKLAEIPRIEVTKPHSEKHEKKHVVTEAPKADKTSELDALEDLQDKETQEELIKYIDQTMGNETNLGKKAEFLMAMLEDYPEDRYLGMSPVEEPIIVPRKRKSRHICDDEKHMHGLLHKHGEDDCESSKQLITTEASIEHPPRKPSRDFAKYLAAAEGCSDSDDSCFSSPIRKHRPPSRKALPSPPSPPKLTKSLSETHFRNNVTEAVTSTPRKEESKDYPKAHTPRTLKRIISMPSTTNMIKPESRSTTPQPVLLKSNSSSSFLIKDLQKAHISVGSFTPEDHSRNHHDELVKPKHSLAVRKISVKSMDSSTPTPQEELAPPKFTIGSKEVIKSPPSPISLQPPAIPKRRKSSGAELKQESMVIDPVSHKKPLLKETLKYDLGSFLESSQVLQNHDVSNVIANVYNATDSKENILQDFQQYLEDHINAEMNDEDSKNPNVARLRELLGRTDENEDKLEDVKIDLVASDDSNKSSEIDECFDSEFEKIEKTHLQNKTGDLLEVPHRKPRHDSVDDVSDWFESGSDIESVVEEADKLGNMVKVKSTGPRLGRRESIEDVDSWFSKHNALSEGEEIIGVRKQRRGSDGLAYDTSRQYPFGVVKHRRDSLSADMFEDITKLHDLGVSKDKTSSPQVLGKNNRLQERRGSDGLVFYDTSRKFPFGEPNTELPKVLLGEQDPKQEANQEKEENKIIEISKDVEKPKTTVNSESSSSTSEHSTLLKFLSKENLI